MKKHDQAQTTAEGLQKLICAATGLQPHEVSVVTEMTDEGCCFHVSEHPDTPMKCGEIKVNIDEEYSREPRAGGWDCSDEEYNYSGYVRDVLNGGW